VTIICLWHVSTEKESRELLPHKNDENATTSRSSSSVDSGGLKDYQQEETYKTSFKTVALCVSILLHLLSDNAFLIYVRDLIS